jgi:aspartyl-tRNA(Asn)/glutamyl-tRNA(Gln) amidotransferase subunit C
MAVTDEQVRAVARLAHVALDPGEIAPLANDLDAILGYVARLSAADVADRPVLAGVLRRRPDVAVPFDADAVLATAPDREDRLVAVPLRPSPTPKS